jgi:hypothetical protein
VSHMVPGSNLVDRNGNMVFTNGLFDARDCSNVSQIKVTNTQNVIILPPLSMVFVFEVDQI